MFPAGSGQDIYFCVMKTIGLIGGTTWLSTIDYYRIINQLVNERLGGMHAAKLILHSVDYGEIVALTKADKWDEIARIIGDAARKAEQAGASCILLCANTMHVIAPQIQAQVSVPVIHIADVTAAAIKAQQVKHVLLLGTRYTMNAPFYPELLGKNDIQLTIPDAADQEYINNSIYEEMGRGLFLPETKTGYLSVISKYTAQGIDGVIMGCTEIPLLLSAADSQLPLFDTTRIHATAAVDYALND